MVFLNFLLHKSKPIFFITKANWIRATFFNKTTLLIRRVLKNGIKTSVIKPLIKERTSH